MKKLAILLVFFLIICSQISSAIDCIIVVDISASLQTNDPEDLRKEALRLFLTEIQNNIQFSDANLSLYTFGESSQLVAEGTTADLERIILEVEMLSRGDDYTDMKSVFEKIYFDFRAEETKRKYLLLFTDGELDSDDLPEGITDLNQYLRELYERATLLSESGFEIHSLAFTRRANINVLRNLAEITSGDVYHAKVPSEAHQGILKLLHSLLEGPYPPNIEREILIDETIAAFSVIATKHSISDPEPKVTIKNPQGQNIDISGIKDVQRSYVRVFIDRPEPGIWKVRVDGAEGVRFYTHKKANYDFIVHQPKSEDLTTSAGTPIFFDVEIISTQDLPSDFFEDSVILVTGPRGYQKKFPVEVKGNRILATLEGIDQPGNYLMELRIITKNKDQISRPFHLNLTERLKFDFEFDADCVIGNSWTVYAKIPDRIGDRFNKFELEVKTPKGKIDRYALYDDGEEKHGDNLAGDHMFSVVTNKYSDVGTYVNKIILIYSDQGRKISSSEIKEIQKLLEVKTKEIKYPRKRDWSLEIPIAFENKSNLLIYLNQPLKIRDEGFKIAPTGMYEIRPKETTDVTVLISTISGWEEKSLALSFFSKCEYSIDSRQIEDDVSFSISFSREKSRVHIWLTRLGVILLVFVVLLFFGIFIITPIRFRLNKKFLQDNKSPGIPYSLPDYRKLTRCSVSIGKDYSLPPGNLTYALVGISIFGYGMWYLKAKHEDCSIDGDDRKWKGIKKSNLTISCTDSSTHLISFREEK